MNTFQLKILAADRVFYQGPCEALILPTTEGLLGIQAHHLNMVTALVPGELIYKLPQEERSYAAISEGIIKFEDNEALILVSAIERPEEIDLNRAREEEEEAKEKLLQQRSRLDFYAAQAQLGRAVNRLRVSQHKDRHLD